MNQPLPNNAPIPEERAFKELKVHIREFGLEDVFARVQTMDHQVIELTGKDTFFYARGKGVLFVAFLPLEAFEGDEG